MKASDALKKIEEWKLRHPEEAWPGLRPAAEEALREKIAREEPEALALRMTDADAVRELKRVRDGCGYPGTIWAKAADHFIAAHEGKEQERPKVTLKEQEAYVRSHSHSDLREHAAQQAAADTLRKLDEEGGKLLASIIGFRQHSLSPETEMCRDLLRSLGVEPKA